MSRGSAHLRDRVLAGWDGFRALAARLDLAAPSRLPGWTRHDVCVHLADWPDAPVLDGLLAQARTGPVPRPDTDAVNAAVVAAHRDAGRAEVLAALSRARDKHAAFLLGPGELADRPVASMVGALPLGTVLGAGAYELAVHALDLAGPRPPAALLDAGLAALVDVTGVFAHRRGLRTTLTAWTGESGWQVRTDPAGWTTAPVRGARPAGAVVEGDAAALLDASAGRRPVPVLLASRAVRVHGLADFLRLAPIVEEVPGLPGGPALRAAARWIGGAGKLLAGA